MNEVTKVLIEARKIISEPEHWTQGVFARDALGNDTDWDSPEAVCWCTAGAIRKAAGAFHYHQEQSIEYHILVLHATKELVSVIGDYGVSRFNDHHNHAQVVEVFNKAITKRQV